jgi:DNA-binding response OmpR family regulator
VSGAVNMIAKGLKVFVVEDEPMIRILLMDMLGELGCRVAAEAGDGEAAAKLAQSTEFDLAILDVNLRGKLITPVAELIRARQLPIIFATGYGSEGLPEEFRDYPALPKPYQLEGLARAIDSVIRSRGA